MNEKTKRFEELLECVLTNEELIGKGEKLSHINQEKSRLEAEKKASNSKFTAKIAECDAKIEEISLAISTKKESRDIECELRYNDPSKGQKTVVRIDTNEIVRVEAMTNNEKNDMFINATGEQDEGFVFNNGRTFPIVTKEDCKPEDAQTWKSVSQPMRPEDMVQANLEKSREYRVIKGEDPDSGDLRYMLQEMLKKGEKPEGDAKPAEGEKPKEKPKSDKKSGKEKENKKPDPEPEVDPSCSNCEGGDLCEGCKDQSNWQPKPDQNKINRSKLLSHLLDAELSHDQVTKVLIQDKTIKKGEDFLDDPKVVKYCLDKLDDFIDHVKKETEPVDPDPKKDKKEIEGELRDLFHQGGITKGEAETFLQKNGNLGMTQKIEDNPSVEMYVRGNLDAFIESVKNDPDFRPGETEF